MATLKEHIEKNKHAARIEWEKDNLLVVIFTNRQLDHDYSPYHRYSIGRNLYRDGRWVAYQSEPHGYVEKWVKSKLKDKIKRRDCAIARLTKKIESLRNEISEYTNVVGELEKNAT